VFEEEGGVALSLSRNSLAGRGTKKRLVFEEGEAPCLSPPNGASLLVLLELWRFLVFSLA
jgi:hypothetical protein